MYQAFVWVLLGSAFSVGSAAAEDQTDSNIAGVADVSFLQAALEVREASNFRGESESSSKLPVGSDVRVAGTLVGSQDYFYSKPASSRRSQDGNTWLTAAREAGLNPSDISPFGQYIPKYTREEVEAILNMPREKLYRFNFVGAVCGDTLTGTMHSIRGPLPRDSRRFRRSWAMEFAAKHFNQSDILDITDVSQCPVAISALMSLNKVENRSSRAFGGSYDIMEMSQEEYLKKMAASEFAICPGGDEPWSMRLYEAALVGAMPAIKSLKEDYMPGSRGDAYGVAIQAVYDLFHYVVLEDEDGKLPTFNQSAVDENQAIFIKYFTFMEGDNVPPGWDDSMLQQIHSPAPEQSALHRQEREQLCIDEYRRTLRRTQEGLELNVPSQSFKTVSVSDRRLVIGAGFGTTGTRSLTDAMRVASGKPKSVWHCFSSPTRDCNVLGLQTILHPSFMGGFRDKKKVRGMTAKEREQCLDQLQHVDYSALDEVNAIFDTPIGEVFIYMWKTYPNARVVLTKRNASDWIDSRIGHHNSSAFLPMQNPCGELIEYPSHLSREKLESLYTAHDDLVRCLVPKRQLFELDLFKGTFTPPTAYREHSIDSETEVSMMNALFRFAALPVRAAWRRLHSHGIFGMPHNS